MNVQNYKKNLKSGKKILKLFNFACKNEEEALKAFKTKKIRSEWDKKTRASFFTKERPPHQN